MDLHAWSSAYRGRIAGSVYAVSAQDRVGAARTLAAAGLDVHIDMMAPGEGLPAGVSAAELVAIAATVDRTRIGVQLIGSPAAVDAMLTDVLAARPGQVFLPWDSFTADRAAAVRDAGSAAWIALWDEWDGLGARRWSVRPDGVLVMLLEPGTSGTSRIGRLALVTACAAELPVAVDGGVTEDIAPLCVTAGAETMVVGRALFGARPRERSIR